MWLQPFGEDGLPLMLRIALAQVETMGAIPEHVRSHHKFPKAMRASPVFGGAQQRRTDAFAARILGNDQSRKLNPRVENHRTLGHDMRPADDYTRDGFSNHHSAGIVFFNIPQTTHDIVGIGGISELAGQRRQRPGIVNGGIADGHCW